jgi:diguanylate cyclase (GGDEF)-like protein/PAS domain S-box-containing protein
MRTLRDLPVARKFVLVIGLYVLVIMGLLLLSYLGMSAIAGLRAYITGEDFWSRGQKNAVYHLARYAATRDKNHYREYLRLIESGHAGLRTRGEQRPPSSVWQVLYSLQRGRFGAGEFQVLVGMFRWLGRSDEIDRLFRLRDEADAYVSKLDRLSGSLQSELAGTPSPARLDRLLGDIDGVNQRLTELELEHALTVRHAFFTLQHTLEQVMLGWTAVFFVLSLTISLLIARHLSRGLTSLRAGAVRVAKGNFAQKIEIRSEDELGDLATAFNQMTTSLVESRRKVEDNTEKLGKALRELENIMETIPDIICILGPQATLDLWNRNLELTTGLGADRLKWVRVSELFVAEDREAIEGAIREGFERKRFAVEGRLLGAGDVVRSYDWTGAALEDAHGNVLGLTVSGRDITQRKALQEQLSHQAFYDPLTNLPNRALFLDRLSHALARKERRDGDLAVLFLDLDRFKVINDSLGHGAGDELLIQSGRRLLACLRPQDTIARLGGDEFGVLLEDVDVQSAIQVAERILTALHPGFDIGGREVFVTASIGVALSRSHHTQPDELIRDADLAMYQAKAKGKARYEIFDRGMNARVLERMELEMDLRSAIARQEFKIYYQPVVHLGTGAITEVEALVRWEHVARGLLPPADFINLSEETGLIVPLGKWVLVEACRQVMEWQTQYPTHPPLTVSVNLSARQFQQPNLVQEIRQALAATGLDSSTLKLEITETVLMHDAPSTLAKLRALKALGIHIAIDDFGTGYSSLGYLKRFPLDTLKIDRSFVDGIVNNTDDRAIVRAVVTVAKSLNLSVTAEGIETDEQLGQLWSLGCDRGQGFYFARPLAARAMGELLEADQRRRASARDTMVVPAGPLAASSVSPRAPLGPGAEVPPGPQIA